MIVDRETINTVCIFVATFALPVTKLCFDRTTASFPYTVTNSPDFVENNYLFVSDKTLKQVLYLSNISALRKSFVV